MGFYSWNTSDTKEEIWNSYTDSCRPVYMYLPDGRIIEEKAYQGYGVFGGLKVFDMIQEFNPGINDVDVYGCRLVDLEFPPKFSFSKDKEYSQLEAPEYAKNQGFFGRHEDEEYLNDDF